MSGALRIVGDFGGTNVRLAWADPAGDSYHGERVYACAKHDGAASVIHAFLSDHGHAAPAAICLAVAGAVRSGHVHLVNSGWEVDAAQLGARFNHVPVDLLNDFAAIAWSLPSLSQQLLLGVGSKPPDLPGNADWTVAVVGPGTGLGVAALLQRQGRLEVVSGEGGHAGFAPESSLQERLLKWLRAEFGRISRERLVSGSGIEALHVALLAEAGEQPIRPSAGQIFERAGAGDPTCQQTVELFMELLGQVAGDVALSFGAFDGIFLAGGILPRYPEWLQGNAFRRGFENKGRYRSLLERVPAALIMHPQPGLLGAARWLASASHRQ